MGFKREEMGGGAVTMKIFFLVISKIIPCLQNEKVIFWWTIALNHQGHS